MTDEQRERALGLSPAQVAGSALAAVTAAVFASFAGTAGTIIGAALGSVVATIGAAAYTAWLRRSAEAVRRTAAQVRQQTTLTGALPRRVGDGPLRPGKRSRRGGDPIDDDAETDTEDGFSLKLLPWRKIALSTVAVLVVTFGGITAVEAITGKPISALLGQNDSTGTTLGDVSRGGAKKQQEPRQDEETRTPEPTPSSRPSDTATPRSEPTPTQDPEPSAPPAVDPTAPTPTPTPTGLGTAVPEDPAGDDGN